jgi:hypothetical protein
MQIPRVREKKTIGLRIDSARLAFAREAERDRGGQVGLKRLSISEDADDAGILEFLLLDISDRLADRERRYGNGSPSSFLLSAEEKGLMAS